MKITNAPVRFFFGITSFFSPVMAANIAFSLFQTTRKKVRSKELQLFETARHYKVPGKKEDIDCYELGNPKGELVLLIHGWDSNAGSMSAIAHKLASLNYRVIAFNLPAHGSSTLKKANLLECSHALLNVIGSLNPDHKFSIVSHSFGSAVAAFTLSKVQYPLDKIMFLTTPNRLIDIFDYFVNTIGLGKRAYQLFIQKAEALLGESPLNINVEDKMKNVSFDKFIILHDLFDKVISHKTSLDVHNSIEKSRLITTVGVGHYRMLWDEKVLDQIDEFYGNERLIVRKAG